jgi:predicted PurR-regulated permease PerM
MMKDFLPRWDGLVPRILGIAGLFVIVAGLKLGKELFVSLALAALLSFILAPLVNLLKKARFPKVLSVIVVVTFALGALGGLGYVLFGQISSIGAKLPEYRQNVLSKIAAFNVPFLKTFKDVQDAVKEVQEGAQPVVLPKHPGAKEAPVRVEVVHSSPSLFSMMAGAFVPSMGALGNAAAILLLVLFFLIYSSEIRDRVIRLAGSAQGTLASQTISDSMRGVVRYLSLQVVVNVAHGTALGLGLWAFGVPNSLLWGFLGALLRFVPYLGPVVSGLLPVVLCVAVFPTWSRPLWVAGFVIALETLSNNVVEPLVYGKRTGLSPLAIIVTAVFWAWLWGGMGLLLSVPLTVCLLMLGKHVPQLKFLEILLGGEPVADPKVQIYLRLLARNPVEAAELIEKETKGKSLVEQCDSLLLPVLRMVEADRKDAKIDEQKALDVIEEIREFAKDATETAGELQKGQSGVPSTPAAEPSGVTILCLPVNDDTDEIAGCMLTGVLTQDRYQARCLPASSLAGENLEVIEAEKADIVVISALPPSNILRARYLYKRLRARFPELRILVGLWGIPETSVLESRIAPDRKATVVGSLAAAREKLRELIEAVRLKRAHNPKDLRNPAAITT